jgi:glycosyltransferase involved in cell wall biosynthesis
MLHIAVFCKTLLKGGAEKQAIILARLLSENTNKVYLINWFGNNTDPENLKNINTTSINYLPLKGSFSRKFILFLRILKVEKISIILSYLSLANFIIGIAKLFSRNIITIGGIRNEQLPFHKFIFEKWVHNYLNDATVFNNFSAKSKFVNKGFNIKKIYVIHNAINISPIEKYNNKPKGEINLVMVARFVKQKDIQTALYSFKRTLERNQVDKLTFTIVGYGPLENDIRLLVERLDLKNEVKILTNPGRISDILAKSDIYLSTSLFEGLSNSIMEAMAVGLPIIATDVGDNRYLVKNARNGYLVPRKDINLIVEKLDHLIKFENERIEFGNNSRMIIESEFTEERMLENYRELFSKLRLI